MLTFHLFVNYALSGFAQRRAMWILMNLSMFHTFAFVAKIPSTRPFASSEHP